MAVVTKEKTQVEKNTEKPSKASADKASKNEPTPSQERLKALGLALDSIKKQYGDGSIMKLG
ncbi:MAG TPA: hypothetical protein PKH78_06180, partial [Candidatus Obscuribacter sp.]|nr:hypothetical protein [Candidatus Obscuribacter sp.]